MRIVLLLLLLVIPALAHHGGASTSQGPGTPIETNTPLTLPSGHAVVYTRAELVRFQRFDFAEPNNVSGYNFVQLGASYGISDCLSMSLILPYNQKFQDGVGSASYSGFGDARILLNLGLNIGEDGLNFNGPEDVVANLAETGKWYIGPYVGVSLPTGRADIDPLGTGVERGLQPGFGSWGFSGGISATGALTDTLYLAVDTGVDYFTQASNGAQFGTEWRANLAGVLELYADKESTFRRLDGILELNYLHVGRDYLNGTGEEATGGRILYISPGARLQIGDFNLGMLLKLPISQALNEQAIQQGAEGLEKFRLIFTLSRFF